MTNPGAKTVEPRPTDALATLSDHLARLLQHADKLLREWEAHAEGLRARVDAETRSTSEVLQKALAQALDGLSALVGDEIQKAAGSKASALRSDLEKASAAAAALSRSLEKTRAPGGEELQSVLEELRRDIRALGGGRAGRRWRPDQLLIVLVLLANALGAAVLVAVLNRPTPTPPTVTTATAPPTPAPEPAPVVVPEPAVPDAAPAAPEKPRAVAPPPGPCDRLPADPGLTPARLIQVCVNQLCSPFPPLKVDGTIKAGGALGKTLAACKAADVDLLATMVKLEREKAIYRLTCPLPDKNEDGTMTVTVRWLLSCSTK